jgi:hypothetical protein
LNLVQKVLTGLNAASRDKGVEVAGGDAHMPADLDERDAPLEDQSAHKPQ